MNEYDRLIEAIVRALLSLHKERDRYIKKHGVRRFSRTHYRILCKGVERFLRTAIPHIQAPPSRYSRAQRRQEVEQTRARFASTATQMFLPLASLLPDELATHYSMYPDKLRDEMRKELCPKIAEFEIRSGGINRRLFQYRIMLGCDRG